MSTEKQNKRFYKKLYGVAYCGKGIYKPSFENRPTKCYSVWKSMVDRCYSEKSQKSRPTYVGCSVCEEWLNFQNFGKWFDENWKEFMGKNWHLDKDILVKGNKVYSPETCTFVPNQINVLFRTEFYSSDSFKCGIRLTAGGKFNVRFSNTHIGNYVNYSDAILAYKKARKERVLFLAEKWKDKISPLVCEAMLNYKIEIYDI